jgi:putative transposase
MRHRQSRYSGHLVKDEADYRAPLDYVPDNPVKHGLARQAEDWPYSAFRHWVRQGVYPLDWAGREGDLHEFE